MRQPGQLLAFGMAVLVGPSRDIHTDTVVCSHRLTPVDHRYLDCLTGVTWCPNVSAKSEAVSSLLSPTGGRFSRAAFYRAASKTHTNDQFGEPRGWIRRLESSIISTAIWHRPPADDRHKTMVADIVCSRNLVSLPSEVGETPGAYPGCG